MASNLITLLFCAPKGATRYAILITLWFYSQSSYLILSTISSGGWLVKRFPKLTALQGDYIFSKQETFRHIFKGYDEEDVSDKQKKPVNEENVNDKHKKPGLNQELLDKKNWIPFVELVLVMPIIFLGMHMYLPISLLACFILCIPIMMSLCWTIRKLKIIGKEEEGIVNESCCSINRYSTKAKNDSINEYLQEAQGEWSNIGKDYFWLKPYIIAFKVFFIPYLIFFFSIMSALSISEYIIYNAYVMCHNGIRSRFTQNSEKPLESENLKEPTHKTEKLEYQSLKEHKEFKESKDYIMSLVEITAPEGIKDRIKSWFPK